MPRSFRTRTSDSTTRMALAAKVRQVAASGCPSQSLYDSGTVETPPSIPGGSSRLEDLHEIERIADALLIAPVGRVDASLDDGSME